MPEYTGDVTGLGTLRLLEAIRKTGIKARFYQASSSEMFGAAPPPQSEATPFQPQSPYAAAKVYAYYVAQQLPRGLQDLRLPTASSSTTNRPAAARPSSPARSPGRPTRIKLGLQEKLYLGNLEAKRDWGFAGDYVEAMWLMLQQEQPDDYVIATGETHSVREFAEKVFAKLGPRLPEARGHRPAVFPAHGGGRPSGRCHQGAQGPRLGAEGQLRSAHRHDGRGGPGDRRKGEDPSSTRAITCAATTRPEQ